MAPSLVQAAVSLMLVGSAWAGLDTRYAVQVLDKRAGAPSLQYVSPSTIWHFLNYAEARAGYQFFGTGRARLLGQQPIPAPWDLVFWVVTRKRYTNSTAHAWLHSMELKLTKTQGGNHRPYTHHWGDGHWRIDS
ncbi:hypothetical protein D0Z07_1807 [Hyphodiscus hymeniophilus]|uniref:Uncharacterized protein n=1 Tax=Hyphodiscus hymeniophilus TaxID=353542 RepID=A0A9P6VNJ7_9HELO|nr:hypothetical protein D0Z07_1807 [Hyphodiscus hymeniophilus]